MRSFFPGIISLLCAFMLFFSPCSASPAIHINIPEYKLSLIDNGQVIKCYNIAVGTPYEQTPTGEFTIFLKEKHPTWIPGAKFSDHTPVPPGPDNPLGSRWMEFKPNYGIHGTNKGWDIEYPVSGGCVRMHDNDVQELYEMVDIGTPVIITYQTMFLYEKADGLYLKLLPDIYSKNTNSYENFAAIYAPFAGKYPSLTRPHFPENIDVPLELKIASLPTDLPKTDTQNKKQVKQNIQL